jgi:(E)-4-hydroxy-3-methylbut-2-enyl-diphosphate synthase
VRIQSMTNTDTANIEATVQQILELEKAGSEMVRITVDRPDSAKAVPRIVEKLRKVSSVPIIGDFHFNGHILLTAFPEMANSLDKYRINPGNLGKKGKRDEHFEAILQIAKTFNKPIRIGVNGGSIDQDLLDQEMQKNANRKIPLSAREVFERTVIRSVLLSASFAVEFGIPKNQLVLSAKLSHVPSMIRVYRSIAKKTDIALHIGLTEAGGGEKGVVASAIALGTLLQEGIGDTIRVSITPRGEESRTKEVKIAREILQSLGIRYFSPEIVSCPGCGRTTGNLFQKFAEMVEQAILIRMKEWGKRNVDIAKVRIAVMGCVVNGPGEARDADVGIFFPGRGEGEYASVFVKGKHYKDLKGKNILEEFMGIIEKSIGVSE